MSENEDDREIFGGIMAVNVNILLLLVGSRRGGVDHKILANVCWELRIIFSLGM